MRDPWDPERYDRFERERSEPFFDLVALLDPTDKPRVVDLGCGTAKLTRRLHAELAASDTIGADSSPAMLAEAPVSADDPSFRVVEADIADDVALDELDIGAADIVISNAAFQWVPDHLGVLERVARRLGSAAHRVRPPGLADVIQPPSTYAEALYRWGFAQQHVRLQVYGHLLDDTAAVVTWVRATLLQRYLSKLPDALHEPFVARFSEALLAHEGDRRPYFYAFSRILIWGRLPEVHQ